MEELMLTSLILVDSLQCIFVIYCRVILLFHVEGNILIKGLSDYLSCEPRCMGCIIRTTLCNMDIS